MIAVEMKSVEKREPIDDDDDDYRYKEPPLSSSSSWRMAPYTLDDAANYLIPESHELHAYDVLCVIFLYLPVDSALRLQLHRIGQVCRSWLFYSSYLPHWKSISVSSGSYLARNFPEIANRSCSTRQEVISRGQDLHKAQQEREAKEKWLRLKQHCKNSCKCCSKAIERLKYTLPLAIVMFGLFTMTYYICWGMGYTSRLKDDANIGTATFFVMLFLPLSYIFPYMVVLGGKALRRYDFSTIRFFLYCTILYLLSFWCGVPIALLGARIRGAETINDAGVWDYCKGNYLVPPKPNSSAQWPSLVYVEPYTVFSNRSTIVQLTGNKKKLYWTSSWTSNCTSGSSVADPRLIIAVEGPYQVPESYKEMLNWAKLLPTSTSTQRTYRQSMIVKWTYPGWKAVQNFTVYPETSWFQGVFRSHYYEPPVSHSDFASAYYQEVPLWANNRVPLVVGNSFLTKDWVQWRIRSLANDRNKLIWVGLVCFIFTFLATAFLNSDSVLRVWIMYGILAALLCNGILLIVIGSVCGKGDQKWCLMTKSGAKGLIIAGILMFVVPIMSIVCFSS